MARAQEAAAGAAAYPTKVCPRCGAELFSDMSVCYGCLYDFSRDVSRTAVEGMPPGSGEPERGDTVDLSAAARAVDGLTGEVGMLVRTASVDLWVGVPEGGLSIGRGPGNDVVLHSPAISQSHLRVEGTPEGMEVCDLGATNPARYRGRDVRGRIVVPYGDALDVCGCVLVMTGPS